MSESNLIFKIEQKAKKSGADKYICTTNSDFNIYVPQSISRKDGSVLEFLNISIKNEPSTSPVGL
jgi:hypothetical protein